MAAGEYVLISSQSDIETADLACEQMALAMRDELGIHDLTRARPIQAALASAAAFAVARRCGAALWRGAVARCGGVTFWGAIGMVSTALIGKLVGSPV